MVARHSFREITDGEETIEELKYQAIVARSATHQFSQFWIKEEAQSLLKTIQDVSTKMIANRSKVVLAGYGLGGLVVKEVLDIPLNKMAPDTTKAVITANTTPTYYRTALNISSLVRHAIVSSVCKLS